MIHLLTMCFCTFNHVFLQFQQRVSALSTMCFRTITQYPETIIDFLKSSNYHSLYQSQKIENSTLYPFHVDPLSTPGQHPQIHLRTLRQRSWENTHQLSRILASSRPGLWNHPRKTKKATFARATSIQPKMPNSHELHNLVSHNVFAHTDPFYLSICIYKSGTNQQFWMINQQPPTPLPMSDHWCLKAFTHVSNNIKTEHPMSRIPLSHPPFWRQPLRFRNRWNGANFFVSWKKQGLGSFFFFVGKWRPV